MDYVTQCSTKIDRLSSLPPELLLHIFDLAYDYDQLLLEPLSKRLLPYFQRDLYRQIHLSFDETWSALLDTISTSPNLGQYVRALDVSDVFLPPDWNRIQDLARLSPRLESLATGYVESPLKTDQKSAFPALKHLSYEIDVARIIELDTSTLSNLRTLEITFHQTSDLNDSSTSPTLGSLEKLSFIYGPPDGYTFGTVIWKSSLAHIVDCCPNITSLKLSDPYHPDYGRFLSSISTPLSRLTSLELESDSLDDFPNICCDHILPRFSSLTCLSLGAGTSNASLPTFLRQLALLTSLRLGPDAHWGLVATDFFTLLQGPTRHPSLQYLSFECFGGERGHRMKSDDRTGQIPLVMMRDGWRSPEFPDNFTEEDAAELQRICTSNGMSSAAYSAATALAIKEDFDLEHGNRTVLHCFVRKNLDALRYHDGSPRYPHIPVDKLDPQNLKLVKTDLPEKNWFRLSLE
ncbi:hypothetical protein JCM5353_004434 [Sporobolomyces roseus]